MTRLLSWAQRGIGLLLLVLAVSAVVAPVTSWFVLSARTVWILTALVLVLWWLGRRRSAPVARLVQRRPRRVVAVGAAVGGLLVLAHLPLAQIDFGWDARQVVWGVEELVAGEPLTQGRHNYFSKYPNNVPILALFTPGAMLGAELGLSPVVSMLLLQGLGVGVIIWCLGATMVLLDRPGSVLPVQALATALLGLNAQTAIPYSDVPAATFVAVCLWAAVRADVTRRRRWWVVALAALVAAVSIKVYAIALACGALALVPALARRRGATVAVAAVVGGAVALGAGVAATTTAAARLTQLPAERLEQIQDPYPMEHFLAMGTYDSQDPSPTRVYGGWNWEHASAMKHERDPELRREISRQKIRTQVLERGVVGNLSFTTRKIAWTWGDGTFWAHGEGVDREKPGLLPERWSPVQAWFIGSGEPYRQVVAPVLHSLWTATLLLTALGLWRARARPWVVACWVSLLALTGYLALFEARPRYLVALLPVLLVLAGLTAGSAPSRGSADSGRRAQHADGAGKTVPKPTLAR